MRGLGAISLVALLLSWFALDDITTDNATAFPLEYSFLVLTGIWFAALGGWLLSKRKVAAGVVSFAAVALGVAAFWSLPHHYQPFSMVNYFGCVPLVWFVGLTVWLLAGRRRSTAA